MATFIRLVDYDSNEEKNKQFHHSFNTYHRDPVSFSKIPGSPIVYWSSDELLQLFARLKISDNYRPRFGMSCGDGEQFIRLWFEVDWPVGSSSGKGKWVPLDKGGAFRKWYGNMNHVINWKDDGKAVKDHPGSAVRNEGSFFKRHVSWTLVGSTVFSARYFPESFIIDTASNYLCDGSHSIDEIITFLNSKSCQGILMMLNPTLNFSCGVIGSLPAINTKLDRRAISISKADWDQHEFSMDFKRNPLFTKFEVAPEAIDVDGIIIDWYWPGRVSEIGIIDLVQSAEVYKKQWVKLFAELHLIETKLNTQISQIINENDCEKAAIPFSEITILQEEVSIESRNASRVEIDEAIIGQQFISYGVGCLMGRYSVEKDGLILADAGATIDDFKIRIPSARFFPDPDGIIPLTDEDDFSDDLPTAFKSWLRFLSGDHYDENLRWIENRLGKNLRSYFDRDFYKDHVKRYKSRPIYWMISSPSGAFRALIYLHRYTKDTVGKVLNDYVRPYRTKLDQKIRGLESMIDSGSSSSVEKTKAKKRLAQLEKYKVEIETWEKEKLYPLALKRVELDLDDGVKVNYRKLEGILEPVKQLETKDEED